MVIKAQTTKTMVDLILMPDEQVYLHGDLGCDEGENSANIFGRGPIKGRS